MSVSYNALREADLEPVAALRDQWFAQISRLESRESDIDDTRRTNLADDIWSGTVSDQARAVTRVIGDDLGERAIECRRIAGAIADALEEFHAGQAALDELVSSPPPGVRFDHDGHALPYRSHEARDVHNAGLANVRITEILEAVTEADQTLHAAIAAVAGTANTREQADLNGGVALANDFQNLVEGGAAPAVINDWWQGLSTFEQQGLLDAHPELLAPVDGIPSQIRDPANRTLLAKDLSATENRIDRLEALRDRLRSDGTDFRDGGGLAGTVPTDEYRDIVAELAALQDRRDAMSDLRDRIDAPVEVAGGVFREHLLIGYDSGGDGRAIVAVGDPDTADNVNVYVPGTGADLARVGADLDRAETMATDAYEYGPAGSKTASIMWLGYEAPDTVVPQAMDTGYAERATSGLSSFSDGLRATAEGERANLTVTGHSYGSTTIGIAARDSGLAVDNIIFAGSPGVGVDRAHELGVDPSNVWATRNEEDIIAYAKPFSFPDPVPHGQLIHGTDPTHGDFGGRTFTSEATRYGTWLGAITDAGANHSAYWDEANEVGRRNLALITTGQAEHVG